MGDLDIPWMAIGNKELANLPDIGETTLCWMCGKQHEVEYGEEILIDGTKIPSKLMAFFKCRGRLYMCGINGKELKPPKM
jgi:hypothetical protein